MRNGIATLIALFGLTGAAQAAETYPSDIRIITPTQATSHCIGDRSTPICAMETALACTVREGLPGCWVRGRGVAKPFNPAVSYRIESVDTYRLECSKAFCPQDVFVDIRITTRDETYLFELRKAAPQTWIVTDNGIEGLKGGDPDGPKYILIPQ